MMFEHGGLVTGSQSGMVVIANEATALHLTAAQAQWLATVGIPAALMQLEDPE